MCDCSSETEKSSDDVDSYRIDEIPADEKGLGDAALEVQRAKLFLKRHCPEAGDNL